MFSLSEAQLETYLQYIGYPLPFPSPDLAALQRLHTLHIGNRPYSNLKLHYRTPPAPRKHAIDLDPDGLFERLVSRGVADRAAHPSDAYGVSLGGYCMENSILFWHILKALGFNAYMAGVKIRPRSNGIPHGDYMGWVHLVNIVTFPDGTRFSCDVSFGGDGPLHPMPMIHRDEPDFEPPVLQNLGAQQIRLVHDHIPPQTVRTPATRRWIYQYRNGPSLPWNAYYAIADTEFAPEDFEVMNFYTAESPQSFQLAIVLLIKFLLGTAPSGEPAIVGKLMLVDGVVKQNLGSQTETLRVCETEAERVEALRTLFGVHLRPDEADGIRGKPTALK